VQEQAAESQQPAAHGCMVDSGVGSAREGVEEQAPQQFTEASSHPRQGSMPHSNVRSKEAATPQADAIKAEYSAPCRR